MDPTLWRAPANYATGQNLVSLPQLEDRLEEAASVARERRFFRWELEFPKVFFDRQGGLWDDGAGFDAVVGNPPYVRQQQLHDLKPCLAESYPETYHGIADLYVYFCQLGFGNRSSEKTSTTHQRRVE